MEKWYRTSVTKVILFVAVVISGAMMVTNIFSILTLAGSADLIHAMDTINVPFEESRDFDMMVEDYMFQVMDQIRMKSFFETDGVYDENKLIDIMEYAKDEKGTGGLSKGKLSYTLRELVSWSEDFSNNTEVYDENGVIVCLTPDGKYYYYYTNEFMTLIQEQRLIFYMEEEEDSSDHLNTFLKGLLNGKFTSSGYYDFLIYGSDGKLMYTDCWNFGKSLREKYAPAGAENLLSVVNENAEFNGKLSIIYENMASALNSLYYNYMTYKNGWEYLEEGNTNFQYLYANENTKKVSTNVSKYRSYGDLEKNLSEMVSGSDQKYMIIYPKLKDFDTNMKISSVSEWDNIKKYGGEQRWNSTFAVAIDTRFPIRDNLYEGAEQYRENVPYLKGAIILTLIFAVFFVVGTIWLTLVAGRRKEDGTIVLNAFDRWKTELAAVFLFLVWYGCAAVFSGRHTGGPWAIITSVTQKYAVADQYVSDAVSSYSDVLRNSIDLMGAAVLFAFSLFSFLCFFIGYVSLIKRAKAHTLWENSVMKSFGDFFALTFRQWSQTKRIIILTLGFAILFLGAFFVGNRYACVLLFGVQLVLGYFSVLGVIAKERIRKGIEEIASGNISYQIPTDGLRKADKKLAEMVNDIGNGLNRAIEEGMRNERLKTDLITNVSHDIKTPLTSIINYVDVLKHSGIQDARTREYLDILEEKAQRLKTLTEDVVEASKISSGNIKLEYMNVNLVEMIQQTQGEMEEKFADRNLTMVTSLPDQPAIVRIDGRRMWRVFENIFGNAVKYAMPGTRVYADVVCTEDKVLFTLKNVSEQELNISANELTERFIQGDLSRSTEGSGLGLSIAKSLTEMMGGTFEIYLDGDLFRVNIEFSRVTETSP